MSSIKISQLPPYIGTGIGTSEIPASINGTTYKISASQILSNTQNDNASHNKGYYDVVLNQPTLVSGVGTIGDYYVVSTEGTFDGILYKVDDIIEYGTNGWFKLADNNQSSLGGNLQVTTDLGNTTTNTIISTSVDSFQSIGDPLIYIGNRESKLDFLTGLTLKTTDSGFHMQLIDNYLAAGDVLLKSPLVSGTIALEEKTIPITGTTYNNPITGALMFDGVLNSRIYSAIDNGVEIKESQIQIAPGYLFINSTDSLNNESSAFDITPSSIKITSLSLGLPAIGISSDYDYSANITDLDYTQKKYVDDRITISTSGLVSNATHTGDVSGSTVLTLASVNSNIGTFGSTSSSIIQTVNEKGLVISITQSSIQIDQVQVNDLVSNLSSKQEALVSGLNIKTINGTSLLGSGDLSILMSLVDASETVAGKVSVGTQTFGGNKTIVGESSLVGNSFEVQNSAHISSLQIPNSNSVGTKAILRTGTSEIYTKSQGGGVAFAGVENTSTVQGYPKKFSFGNDNLWNIETEYYAGYGIAFVNRLGGKTFATATLYLGSQGSVADRVGIGTITPTAKLDVSTGVTTNQTAVNATGTIDDFFQYNVKNTSTGTKAQSGYAATANNGTATTGFAWMGINNSNFNFPTAYNIGGANDVSYVGSGQDLYIANANNTKSIIFSTGKATTPFFDERMRITNNGKVSIGTANPDKSAILQVDSTTLGFLPPRMTTEEKDAILGPVAGLMVFDTTLMKLCIFTTVWETITSI